MADKAISELVAAEQIKSTDMFVLEQDGTAKRLQGQTLLNWLTAAADGHGGISNIVKTGTDGLVDTYTITLADTTTKTFTVTNGNGLTKFEKLSTVGLVDTYQFTRSDGTYFTFAVSNGAKGDTGDASHVWIKYASQQPTVNSHSIGDNPDDWMGVYSGTAETAPTDWQAYSWYQIKGDKGDTGAPATVTGVTAEYIVSDSGTIVPSGSWSTTIPSVPQGKYLWTRSTTNFNTGDPAVSYSVTRMGIDGIGSVSSVNDKSPSDSGNVTLTAGDIQASGNASVQEELDNAVKYNTPQTLTDAQKQQARDNINAPAPYEAGDNISISGRIITTKAFPCNPNLLINWYFGNPVNQRGTSFVENNYGLDMWKGTYGVNTNGTMGFNSSGFAIQVLEDSVKGILDGMMLTASILYVNGTLQTGTAVYTKTGNAHNFIDSGPIQFNNQADGNILLYAQSADQIKAVKLELGSQQTLAHQENGVWVLNEIPKFGDQLAECQRYLFAANGKNYPYGCVGSGFISSDGTEAVIIVPTPVSLRTLPVCEINGVLRVDTSHGEIVTINNVAVYNIGSGAVCIHGEFTGTATAKAPCYALLDTGHNLLLSAEL